MMSGWPASINVSPTPSAPGIAVTAKPATRFNVMFSGWDVVKSSDRLPRATLRSCSTLTAPTDLPRCDTSRRKATTGKAVDFSADG
jgi:hypothetical protein